MAYTYTIGKKTLAICRKYVKIAPESFSAPA